MPILTNVSRRAYTLPVRTSPDGELFGARVPGASKRTTVCMPAMLDAGASIEVPDWYLEELRREPGLAVLLDAPEGLRIEAPPVSSAAADVSPLADSPRPTRSRRTR